jgi:hypothetical protein
VGLSELAIDPDEMACAFSACAEYRWRHRRFPKRVFPMADSDATLP